MDKDGLGWIKRLGWIRMGKDGAHASTLGEPKAWTDAAWTNTQDRRLWPERDDLAVATRVLERERRDWEGRD